MAVKTRGDHFNCCTNIDSSKLYPTSHLVSTITGMVVPPVQIIDNLPNNAPWPANPTTTSYSDSGGMTTWAQGFQSDVLLENNRKFNERNKGATMKAYFLAGVAV